MNQISEECALPVILKELNKFHDAFAVTSYILPSGGVHFELILMHLSDLLEQGYTLNVHFCLFLEEQLTNSLKGATIDDERVLSHLHSNAARYNYALLFFKRAGSLKRTKSPTWTYG